MKNDMHIEIMELKNEIHYLKEQLQYFIPRRRVRRIYKMLGKILNQDLQNDNKQYIELLKEFIQKIEKEGQQMAGQDIKTAIEHLISIIDLG